MDKTPSNEIWVLHDGYSRFIKSSNENLENESVMEANCSCTLIRNAKYNIIVDTMTPWDGQKIEHSLQKFNLKPDQIHFVISTHGHADHVGNNNLFLNATHIVGFSISKKDKFFLHPFDEGISYFIGDNDADRIEITPTPGHTMDSISVIVKSKSNGTVVIAGDLFEKEEDLQNYNVWLGAGSENKEMQEKHRLRMLSLANHIVPGHGPMFKITEKSKGRYKKLSD